LATDIWFTSDEDGIDSTEDVDGDHIYIYEFYEDKVERIMKMMSA
jgi:hypothetical protein